MTSKVLIALSGGVDSSVAALLLKQRGGNVSGAYMRTWKSLQKSEVFGECGWQEDLADARAVAEKIGIDFEVVNMIDDYQKYIVDYLIDSYRKGLTPNPDSKCNRDIKFGVLREYAKANGFSHIATGHYCRKELGSNGFYQLLEGADKNKDQSYFLALIQQQQLADALFPVGDLQKPEVRAIAEKFQLKTAAKKDSQGICFLGKIPIQTFLREYIADNPGLIVNTAGKVLGEHKGLHLFTIGQRKGIGIASNINFANYVVVGKNAARNELIIAFETPNAPGLYCKSVEIENVSFIGAPITETCKISGKTRYRNPAQTLTFTPISEQRAKIDFDIPQRAITLGQVLALYDGPSTLGGGIYSKIDA